MAAKNKIEVSVDIPDKITAEISDGKLTITGPKGNVTKDFFVENVNVSVVSGKIILTSKKNTKNEKQLIGTFKATINNMLEGVNEGHHYKMKICSGHFPMSVSVAGQEFSVKNFVGEKTPRKLRIPEGVTIKVKGNEIEIEGCDKQMAGNVAGAIEKLTHRPNFDRRIFQDGIVIYEE